MLQSVCVCVVGGLFFWSGSLLPRVPELQGGRVLIPSLVALVEVWLGLR